MLDWGLVLMTADPPPPQTFKLSRAGGHVNACASDGQPSGQTEPAALRPHGLVWKSLVPGPCLRSFSFGVASVGQNFCRRDDVSLVGLIYQTTKP